MVQTMQIEHKMEDFFHSTDKCPNSDVFLFAGKETEQNGSFLLRQIDSGTLQHVCGVRVGVVG